MTYLDTKRWVPPYHFLLNHKTLFFKVDYLIFVFLHRYVVEKDTQNNVVFVSRNYYSLDKKRRTFRVGSLKWLSGFPPDRLDQLQCKVGTLVLSAVFSS